MLHKIKTQTPQRQTLSYIVCFFAISTLFSVLGFLLTAGWLPSFNIKINDIDRSLTSYVFTIAQMVLCLIVLIKLFCGKDMGFSRSSKAGLIVLMLYSCRVLVTEPLLLFGESNTLTSLIIGSVFIIYIIGLFMFIGGSGVDRKLKKFVKWSPFILLAVSCLSSLMFIENIESLHLYQGLLNTTTELFIFLMIYRIAKSASEKLEEDIK